MTVAQGVKKNPKQPFVIREGRWLQTNHEHEIVGWGRELAGGAGEVDVPICRLENMVLVERLS